MHRGTAHNCAPHMTTGSIIIGMTNSSLYYNKAWSGADGIVHDTPVPTMFYRWRKVLDKLSSFRTKTYKLKSDGRLVTYHWFDKPRFEKARYEGQWVYKVRHHKQRVTQVNHAYTMTCTRSTAKKGRDPTQGNWLSQADGSYFPHTLSANDDLAALAKLAKQVRGHSFNLGVALGEGRETLRMVHANVLRFSRAIYDLKRGHIGNAIRHLGAIPNVEHAGKHAFRQKPLTMKDVSRQWLELQYGWMPLYQDIYNSMLAYTAITDKARTQKFSATHRFYRDEVVKNWTAGSPTHTTRTTVNCSIRYVYVATEKLSVARSLGLCNPLAVAWELVPFSFVADWFIPIGTYLDALDSIPHLTGTFVRTTKETHVCCGVEAETSAPFKGAAFNSTFCQLVRTIPSSIAVPLPKFNSLKDSLSIGRVKNAIALLHMQVGGNRVGNTYSKL